MRPIFSIRATFVAAAALAVLVASPVSALLRIQPMRPIKALTLALMLSLAASMTAFAHARLESSSPAIGETVAAAATLTITFSEAIELGLSKFDVTGPGGPVAGTTAALETGDGKIVVIRPKAALATGKYTVHWQVVSVDTHRSEGTYSFTVK